MRCVLHFFTERNAAVTFSRYIEILSQINIQELIDTTMLVQEPSLEMQADPGIVGLDHHYWGELEVLHSA